jgi:hypothetical protein
MAGIFFGLASATASEKPMILAEQVDSVFRRVLKATT